MALVSAKKCSASRANAWVYGFGGIDGGIATNRLLLNAAESMSLGSFSEYPNFKLVDRSSLEKAFEELKFQISGAISDDSAKRLGMMAGASHICTINFTQYRETFSSGATTYEERTLYRLIDVERGSVIAVQSFTAKH